MTTKDIEHYEVKAPPPPHVVYVAPEKVALVYPRPKYQSACSTFSLFSSYRAFEDICAQMTLIPMTLKIKGSKEPQIFSPVSSWFCYCLILRPAVFQLQASLKQSVRDDPKRYWTLQGQTYDSYVLLVFPNHRFHVIVLYDQELYFQATGHLR